MGKALIAFIAVSLNASAPVAQNTLDTQITQVPQLRVMPYVSPVDVFIGGVTLSGEKAKLDTGAGNSTIDAVLRNYQSGDPKVTFQIRDQNGALSAPQTLNVVGASEVKMRGPEAQGRTHDVRPTVMMRVALDGGEPIEVEVSLSSRCNFKYAVLLGRDFLKAAHVAVAPIDNPDYVPGDPHVCDNPALVASMP